MSNVYHALLEAGHGRFGAATAALQANEHGPAARAALRATLTNAGLREQAPANASLAPRQAVTGDDLLFHFHALEERFRRALATFDSVLRGSVLNAAMELAARELAARSTGHLALRLALLELWDQVAKGEPVGSRAEIVLAEARNQGLPHITVEAEVVRGWSSLLEGELDEALAHARRASRMASTERLLVPECLAHLLLGHIRRQVGKPYLCVRILTGLRGVVPPLWHRWIDWELSFAAGSGPINQIIDAKRSRNEGELASASEALAYEASAFAPLKRELDGLLAAIDPSVVPDERFSFLRGQKPKAGYIWAAEGDSDGAMAYVRVDSNPRKIMAVALPEELELPRVCLGARQNTRPLSCLVDLAFRPESSAAALFERVYGFAFAPAKHDGSFRVMLHRARQLCGGLADIERSGDSIVLRVHRPFLVADPASSVELDERVLALVGTCEGSPSAIAERLGVTPRAVQQILKRLFEDGVCARDKVGRALAYRVVDTTFTLPSYQ